MVKIRFDAKGNMIRLPDYSPDGYYFDENLLKNLLRLDYRLSKDFMNQIMIVGPVGSGKTTLAFAIQYFLSKGKLKLEDIGVGEKRGLKLLVDCKSRSTNLLDDASSLFFSVEHSKVSQKKAVKSLHLIRDKNINLIITLPDLSKVNSYVATSSNCIIKTYMKKNLNRGRFAFYGTDKVKPLYAICKKNHGNFPIYPRPHFLGRFTDFKPSFYEDYKKEKEKARQDVLYDKPDVYSLKDMKPLVKQLLRNFNTMPKKITQKQFAYLTNLNPATISNYMKEIAQETREISKI